MSSILKTKPISTDDLKNLPFTPIASQDVPPPDLDDFSNVQKTLVRLEAEGKKNTEEYQLVLAQARRLCVDECLIRTQDNLLIVYSHAGFESWWNCLDPVLRRSVKIVRPFWFGLCGGRLDYLRAGARTEQEIADFVSKKLVDSIKEQVKRYKDGSVVCNFYKDKVSQKLITKDETNFRDAYVANFNGIGLQYSTYKYALILGLAGERDLPEIPEDCLTKAEYDELKKEFLPIKQKENK